MFQELTAISLPAADANGPRIERPLSPDIAPYWLKAVIDSADDAIVTKTPDGVITSWNPGAQRLFGYTAEEMIGRSVTILIPEDVADEEHGILARLRAGESIEHYETVRRCKDGTLINISLTVSPIRVPGGEIIGASKIARDITECKLAEEALRESEAGLAAELADAKLLHQISSLLLRQDNIDALYEQFLNSAIALMKSDAGSMQVLDGEKNELRLLTWKGFDPESARFWGRVGPTSHSACGESLRQAERFTLPDVEQCDFMAGTEELASFRRSGLRAVQSTPLTSRDGRIVGMISTHWH